MTAPASYLEDPKALLEYLQKIGCSVTLDVAGDVSIEPEAAVTEPIRSAVAKHHERFRRLVASGRRKGQG